MQFRPFVLRGLSHFSATIPWLLLATGAPCDHMMAGWLGVEWAMGSQGTGLLWAEWWVLASITFHSDMTWQAWQVAEPLQHQQPCHMSSRRLSQ